MTARLLAKVSCVSSLLRCFAVTLAVLICPVFFIYSYCGVSQSSRSQSAFREAWDIVHNQDADKAEKALAPFLRDRGLGHEYLLLDSAICLKHGDHEAAMLRLNQVESTGPFREQWLQLLGQCQLRSRNEAEAETTLLQLASEYPENFDAHYLLGSIYYELGMFGQSLYQLKEAGRLRSSDPRPHAIIGAALFLYGRYKQAAESYEQAVRASLPNVPEEIVTALIRCRLLENNFQAADSLISEHREYAAALRPLKAECLWAMGQLEEAVQICKAILTEDEENRDATVLLTKISIQADRRSTITPQIERLEKILSKKPFDNETRYLLFQCLQKQGDRTRQQLELSKIEEFRELQARQGQLLNHIWAHPEDAQARSELADIAEKQGRQEDVFRWKRSADGCRRRIERLSPPGQ